MDSLWSKHDNKMLSLSGMQGGIKALCKRLSAIKGEFILLACGAHYSRFLIVRCASREPLSHPPLITCILGQGSNDSQLGADL